MSADTTTERDERLRVVIDRVAGLTAEGMKSFIGRLIDHAADKPGLDAEIRNALIRLETDLHLRKCWHTTAADESGKAEVVEAAA